MPSVPATAPTAATPTLASKLLYSRKEAAFLLSISTRSLDYIIAAGRLATRRIGGRILVPSGDLIRFAGRNHTGVLEGAQ